MRWKISHNFEYCNQRTATDKIEYETHEYPSNFISLFSYSVLICFFRFFPNNNNNKNFEIYVILSCKCDGVYVYFELNIYSSHKFSVFKFSSLISTWNKNQVMLSVYTQQRLKKQIKNIKREKTYILVYIHQKYNTMCSATEWWCERLTEECAICTHCIFWWILARLYLISDFIVSLTHTRTHICIAVPHHTAPLFMRLGSKMDVRSNGNSNSRSSRLCCCRVLCV